MGRVEARILDGFLDDLGLLVVRRGSLGRVDGGRLGYTNLLVVAWTEVGRVDSGFCDADVFLVGRLVAAAVFTLDLVNSAVLRPVVTVNFDVCLGVRSSRSGRLGSCQLKKFWKVLCFVLLSLGQQQLAECPSFSL